MEDTGMVADTPVGSGPTGDAAAPVLFVDDEAQNLQLFRMQFEREFPVLTANGADQALDLLGKHPVSVLLTDERMPGTSGIELLAKVIERWPDVTRVIVSAYSDAPRLLAAMNRGHAHEYVVKPWDRDELRACIVRARTVSDRRRALAARAEVADALDRDLRDERGVGEVVTQSAAMLDALRVAKRAAQTDATVLVCGETGTGKELVARAVHEASARAGGPFIRVNCAALSEGILESELFGHEQGAFTGAHKMRRGRFELAQDGTIFLDEIGDISPKLQVSLLRVLQEREIERVGGSATVKVNARVVAATHRNLAKLSREGRFREDLYYRLNVVPVVVPPLRERQGDVPILVRHFLMKHGGDRPPEVTPEVLEHLSRYTWPGNVRELENMVHRALVLATSRELTLDDFRFTLTVPEADEPPAMLPREEARLAEREELRRLLVEHGGNLSRVARELNVPRTTLVSRAKKHGLIV